MLCFKPRAIQESKRQEHGHCCECGKEATLYVVQLVGAIHRVCSSKCCIALSSTIDHSQ